MKWRDIYWRLMHPPGGMEGWTGRAHTAEEIEQMTPAEIALALESGEKRTEEGFVPMDPAAMVAWAEKYRAMGMADRVRKAKEE